MNSSPFFSALVKASAADKPFVKTSEGMNRNVVDVRTFHDQKSQIRNCPRIVDLSERLGGFVERTVGFNNVSPRLDDFCDAFGISWQNREFEGGDDAWTKKLVPSRIVAECVTASDGIVAGLVKSAPIIQK